MEEKIENNNSENEMVDVETLEFGLTSEEIDELILKLLTLKHMKNPFNFEVDDNNELLVSYEEENEND